MINWLVIIGLVLIGLFIIRISHAEKRIKLIATQKFSSKKCIERSQI
jgi:hypothetical protein